MKLLNQASKKLENNRKVSLVGVVLGICVIVVILVSYGQISMLQKNTSSLEANNSSLSGQVSALEAEKTSLLNQTAALKQDVTSLKAQVTALQNQVAQIEGKKTYLNLHIAMLKAKAFLLGNGVATGIHGLSYAPN